MSPVITIDQAVLAFLAWLLGSLAGLGIATIIEEIYNRRTDALMRRGMRAAWRNGLLRDADQ